MKTTPLNLTFSPDGKIFVVMSADRKLRLFNFLTGKLYRVFDEALDIFIDQQQVRWSSFVVIVVVLIVIDVYDFVQIAAGSFILLYCTFF